MELRFVALAPSTLVYNILSIKSTVKVKQPLLYAVLHFLYASIARTDPQQYPGSTFPQVS